jgi:hypothetical protein
MIRAYSTHRGGERNVTKLYVRLEVLTSVVIKSCIFSDITPRSLHILALLATCSHSGFLLGLFFDPGDGGDMFLRKVG